MRECTEEMMYEFTLKACETNNAFFLIALNQEFNFGAVRLLRLIEKYNEVSLMYKDHIRDGFTDEECNKLIRDALTDIGVDPSQVFTDIDRDAFRQFRREKRKAEKNNVPTYTEAEELMQNLKAFKAALREQKKTG